MEVFTKANAQMETLACIIRLFYIFQDKHNSEEEIKYIKEFVEYMKTLERLEDVDEKYKPILDEYLKRIGTEEDIRELVPDVF